MSVVCFLARWTLFALGLGVFGAFAPVRADVGMVGEPVSLCIARAAPGERAADLFAGRIPVDCHKPQRDFGPGDFWLISSPVRRTGEIALRSGSVWQERRTVYALYADGVIVSKVSDGRAATRSLQLGALFLDRLPARGAPLVRVAWKVEGSANLRGIVNGPRLATIRESGWSNLFVAAIYAAFAGMCVALLIHHLALWTAMRHRFQLAYCAMVAVLLGYAFSSSGALAWVFPGIENNDRLRLNYLGLGLAVAAAMLFARSFFEPRVFRGWLGAASWAATIAALMSAVAYALLAPWQIHLLDKLFVLSFLLMISFVPLLLWKAWRERSNYLWVFMLAWGAPVLFAALRIGNNLGLIGWSFWIDHSTMLSMCVEALLSSVGITYRIRLISRERDEARAQELAARALADLDPLTGLLNRRAFLRQAIGREGTQTLFVIDLDHFKAVNETIGHDGGDEVLRVFARGLRAAVADGGLVARFGGEEFVIVMPHERAIDPEALLARLRAERMPFDLTVTSSIGVCSGPLASEGDWKQLYRRADRALYEAKAQGRDRVRTGALRAA